MLKAVSGVICAIGICGAVFAADESKGDVPTATKPQVSESKPDEAKAQEDMKQIHSRISQAWHQPKVTRPSAVSLLLTIDKSGRLKSCDVKKSSGDKAVDEAAVSAIKRAQPFPPLSSGYSQLSINWTFECRPDKNVDDYKLNGVPIKQQGYRITGGGATLRPLDTNSKAEEVLANRARIIGDKVVALTDKLAQQEKAVGTDNPAIIPVLSDLANAQKQLGRYDEADSNFRRLIALEEKSDDKRNLARSLADFGDGYYLRAQYNEAEPIFSRAIALKKELGLSATDVPALEQYAKLLYKLNRTSEADSIYQQIKTLRTK